MVRLNIQMTDLRQEYQVGVDKRLIFPIIDQACEWLEEQEVESAKVETFRLALEELLMNIYQHSGLEGGAFIQIRIEIKEGSLMLQVRDRGLAFDLVAAAEPDTSLKGADRPIGGLGILLIRKMSHHFSYHREEEENVTEVSWVLN